MCTSSFNVPFAEAGAHTEVKGCFCQNKSIASSFSSLGKPLLFSHETENVTQKKNGKVLENMTVFEKGFGSLKKQYNT